MSEMGKGGAEIRGAAVFDLVMPDWPAPASVRAFTTTRKGGISREQWRSLNLSRNCGDDRKSVQKNRILLRTLLPGQPTWLKQVHGTTVLDLDAPVVVPDDEGNAVIGAGAKGVAAKGKSAAAKRAAVAKAAAAVANEVIDEGADAAMTATAGKVCAVLTADCLPVVFCNKAGTRVAVAHAGWRGLAAGVLEATVAAMGCKKGEVIAWMGPAIGPEAFEVGRDVYDAFCSADAENGSAENGHVENAHVDNTVAFKPHGDRWLADLYTLARLALARVGVDDVYGGEYCTLTDVERFYSYRRDGETGRMATLVWIDPA